MDALRSFVGDLRADKGVVALIFLICVLAAGAYALLAPPVYRATVVFLPAQRNMDASSAIAVTGALAQLSALGGAGFRGTEDRAVALATLRSRLLIEQFIKEQDLLPVLFPERWDSNSRSWSVAEAKVPDLFDGYRLFTKDILEIEEDRRTGLVTMSVDWTSSETAAKWANALVDRANAHIRDKTIQESERNLSYLREQASAATILDVKQTIFALMESELKKIMLARGNSDYALRVIDPAQPTRRRYSPLRTRVMALSMVAGLLLGPFVVLVKNNMRVRGS